MLAWLGAALHILRQLSGGSVADPLAEAQEPKTTGSKQSQKPAGSDLWHAVCYPLWVTCGEVPDNRRIA